MRPSSDVPDDPPATAWPLMATLLGAAGLVLLSWALHRSLQPSSRVDGTAAWIFASLSVLVASALAFIFGLLVERQRQRQVLAEARSRTQALAQLLDVWQWQTDRHHRLQRLQPPVGAPPSAWLAGDWGGRPLWEHFDGAAAARAQLESMMPLSDVPVRGRDHSGEAGAWQLRAIPRFDADGQFAGHLGTARSIGGTSVEEAAWSAAPSAVATDAPDMLSEQAAFSYTVTHDLRAPIRVVEGFTRILQEDYGRLLDRVGNDHLDRVLAAAARMNSMIDALLTLANLSAQPLTRQPVNLSQLAGFVIDDLRRSAPQRKVDVDIQAGMVVDGDPTLLRLVLDNLLGNAWKYSARNAQARIGFGCRQHDARQVFCVSDDGAGFEMRNADRLFGVFQRLHSANDFPGTGVGLASVKRIVRRHGGDIWAESEPGQGARFFFTLRA